MLQPISVQKHFFVIHAPKNLCDYTFSLVAPPRLKYLGLFF